MDRENTPALQTERLILRKFTEADIDALFVILSDETVNTFLPWYPAKTREDVEQFFRERFEAVYEKACGYAYAVCKKEDNIPIGYMHADAENAHDFGYGFRRDVWGNGYATEAGRAVLARVKADGIPFVTATHDVKNPKSGEVMKRLGMRYCYSYEEQWQPKDILVTFRMYQLNFDGNDDRIYPEYWEHSAVHFVEEQ